MMRPTTYDLRYTTHETMLNFFEHPWTLIGVAVMVLFGVFTYRSVYPEKQQRWHWLLPLSVVALAFGLDFLVKTDRERIHITINRVMKAFEEEDCVGIAEAIAPETSSIAEPAALARCRLCAVRAAGAGRRS